MQPSHHSSMSLLRQCASRRPRSRFIRWARVIFAVLAGYWTLGTLVPQFHRLDITDRTTWFDLGWYGIMPTRRFISFDHAAPEVEFLKRDDRCSEDHIVFAPRGMAVRDPGGVILDHRGELVWRQVGDGRMDTQDLRVQEFGGQKYLTFWVGQEKDGQKKGSWYMMDETYTIRHHIKCKGGMSCDMHEFQITADGTALLTMYDTVSADLSTIGSSASGWLMDCKFQEVDIWTGELLFEWKASDHFAVEETYRTLGHCTNDPFQVFDGCGHYQSSGFDFFHINSLQKDAQGNYLVSARNTGTISYIDGESGEVLWNLGGKRNDFNDLSDGMATNFSWQHQARWQGDGAISLFDNAYHSWRDADQDRESRAMIIDVDREVMAASLRAQYRHPGLHMRSHSQGSAQPLENGNMFVGWGRSAAFSEFSGSGELLCDAHFGASAFYSFGFVSSYRVFRDKWVGYPKEPPSAVMGSGAKGKGKVYVSWNGATEVHTWLVEEYKGVDRNGEEDWVIAAEFARTGFETQLRVPRQARRSRLRVTALDGQGRFLGKAYVEKRASRGLGGIEWLETPLVVMLFCAVCAMFAVAMCASVLMVWWWCRRRRQQQQGPGGFYRAVFDDEGLDDECRRVLEARAVDGESIIGKCPTKIGDGRWLERIDDH